MLHVISWSGGKDSTAAVILFKEQWNEIMKEGDRAVILFSEVMFDKKNNVSGHNPDVISFIKEKAAIFRTWGFEVYLLRAEKDYLDIFYHRLSRSPKPERVGMVHGFVSPVMCAVKRDLKMKPLEQWLKENKGQGIIQYLGIAVDEPERLESMRKKDWQCISLLEKSGYTEQMAKELCRKHDMLSPQYQMSGGTQRRDGCWFCPHAKLCEHRAVAEKYPEAWEKYVLLEDEPELAYPKWNCYSRDTLKERDRKIKEGLCD